MSAPGTAPPGAAPPGALLVPAISAGTAWVRYANIGYVSAHTDTPANTLHEARVLGDPEIGQSVIDALGVGGRAAITTGEVILANHDRALDSIARDGRADGRRIVLRSGQILDRRASDCGVPLAALATAFTGRVARWTGWGTRLRLSIADALELLDTPLQATVYGGTGGMDGTADLAGLPKPVTLGECFNVTPVFVGSVDLGDGSLPTYQTHWRGINGHTAVRERGVAMTKVSTAPTTGQWRDWPTQGSFQLGFTASGAVTCDVVGDNSVFTALTTTEVVTRMLTSLGPVLAESDLDDRSFDAAAIALPGDIGMHVGAFPVRTIDALAQVCLGALAHVWVTRGGKIGFSALAAPASTPDLTIEEYDQIEIEPLAPPTAFWPLPSVIEVEYGRNWTVQTDIAGSVGDAMRARLGTDALVSRSVSSTSALFTGVSRAIRLPGLWADSADAASRGTALRTLFDRLPTRCRVVTDRYRGQVEIGHTARVARPDIVSGYWDAVVVGWRERLGSQRVELDLWG